MILLHPLDDAELCASLAMWPYVVPTRGKRYALALALYQIARSAMPIDDPAVQAQKRACLARMRVLTEPGEFDSESYDKAAGFPYAWTIDWWTHTLARKLYRNQSAL